MLSKPTLEESASHALKNLILNGELLPGTRLVEATWSKELSISRPTIRAAFQRLTDLGLASRSTYVGWSVAALSIRDLREVAQLRAALEGFAAFLIAGGSAPVLSALTASLERLAQAVSSDASTEIDAADQAFHAALVEGCGNERIAAQHRAISDQLMLAIRAANLTGEPRAQVYQQHLELYRQLSRNDPSAAELAFRTHCLAVLDRLPPAAPVAVS